MNNKTILGFSIIISIILSHSFDQPFTKELSFIYATPQIIIAATLAVLGLTLFLNYLIMDFVKKKKFIPFVVPIGVLLIVSLFAQRFFHNFLIYGSSEMVFFPTEFAGSLVVVTSFTLLIYTLYILSTKIKNADKETE